MCTWFVGWKHGYKCKSLGMCATRLGQALMIHRIICNPYLYGHIFCQKSYSYNNNTDGILHVQSFP